MPLDGQLIFEDGEIRLGGARLPGILVDLSIRGAVRFDQSQKDSQSGKHKVPLGFEDADITIMLDLLCDDEGDCYAKLAQLNKVFRADRQANPKVYAVTNQHCAARGVRNVIFSGLDSYESDENDIITATLAFVEHLPAVIKREKQVSASKAAAVKTGTAPPVKAVPATSTAIVTDEDNAFLAGFKAGNN